MLICLFGFTMLILAIIASAFSQDTPSPQVENENYPVYSDKDIINYAIKNNYKIKIQYTSSPLYKDEEITERIIVPIEMKYGNEIVNNELIRNSEYGKDKIYIRAFCELRNAERHFRPDRLKILELITV